MQTFRANELPAPRREMLEHRERLRRERHDRVATTKLTSREVQTKGSERASGHAFDGDYHWFKKVQEFKG